MDKFGRSAYSNYITRKPLKIIQQSSLPVTSQGAYDIKNNRLSNLKDPKEKHDAVTKIYIDSIRDAIIVKEIPTISTLQHSQTQAYVYTKLGDIRNDSKLDDFRNEISSLKDTNLNVARLADIRNGISSLNNINLNVQRDIYNFKTKQDFFVVKIKVLEEVVLKDNK